MGGIKHNGFYSWNPMGPRKSAMTEEQMLLQEFKQVKFCKVCGKEIFLQSEGPREIGRQSMGQTNPEIWKIERENQVHEACYWRNRHLFKE